MALSECACVWDGQPSSPKLVRGCVAHLEWRNKCTQDARDEEREACASLADDMGRHAATGFEIRDAIRARSHSK